MSNFISNSFQVPNAFVDSMLDKVSGNACKIYLVIVRKTRGWHKESDRLSYSQLLKITGIGSYSTIEKAIDELLSIGLINVKTGNVKASNEYSLNDNFCSATENVVGQGTTETVGATTKTVAEGTTETVDTKDTIKTTNKKTCATAKAPDAVQGMFEQFWAAYPNKKDKKNAWAKFSKINFTKNPFEKIMSSLTAFKQTEDWQKNNGQYVPMPTTWINGERWNDEIPVPNNQPSAVQPIGAAYQPAPQPERKRQPVPPPKGMFDGLFGGVFS